MAAPDPNPYESPQSVTTEPRTSQITPLLRLLLRLTTLAFAGFASFFTIALLFFVVTETLQLEIFPSIPWALQSGILGAGFFIGSEVFNSGKDQNAGFLIRFVASIAVFLLSGIIASFLWPPPIRRHEETDPYWLHRLLIFIAILLPARAFARLVWIGNDRLKAK